MGPDFAVSKKALDMGLLQQLVRRDALGASLLSICRFLLVEGIFAAILGSSVGCGSPPSSIELVRGEPLDQGRSIVVGRLIGVDSLIDAVFSEGLPRLNGEVVLGIDREVKLYVIDMETGVEHWSYLQDRHDGYFFWQLPANRNYLITDVQSRASGRTVQGDRVICDGSCRVAAEFRVEKSSRAYYVGSFQIDGKTRLLSEPEKASKRLKRLLGESSSIKIETVLSKLTE